MDSSPSNLVDPTISIDADIDSINTDTGEDVQNDDSAYLANSPNTDEVVRNLVENSSADAATMNDTTDTHDHSLNTDDVVRGLVEHTIDGEAVPSNDSMMFNSSLLDTDDFVRNLVEDKTANTNNLNDEPLDSIPESTFNDDELDDNAIQVEENTFMDSSDADLVLAKPNDNTSAPISERSCQLPLGRIKSIVKADPDVSVVSGEVIFLISKSCELFLQWLGKEVHAYTIQKKKKTIQKRDLDLAISEHPALEFLDGALD